jgi:hypothetical protein
MADRTQLKTDRCNRAPCNYFFGVNGNSRSLELLLFHARRAWHQWLSRRSQQAYLNWTLFNDLLRDFPLPKPTIRVQPWATL